MKYLYLNKHWEINKEYNLDKLLYSMIDRPNQINMFGSFVWVNNKIQSHREYDLPAYIIFYDDKTCSLYWYVNNIEHRKYNNKPFYIGSDGCK